MGIHKIFTQLSLMLTSPITIVQISEPGNELTWIYAHWIIYKPYWDFTHCPTPVLFLAWEPVQHPTLHLVVTSPWSTIRTLHQFSSSYYWWNLFASFKVGDVSRPSKNQTPGLDLPSKRSVVGKEPMKEKEKEAVVILRPSCWPDAYEKG